MDPEGLLVRCVDAREALTLMAEIMLKIAKDVRGSDLSVGHQLDNLSTFLNLGPLEDGH